MGDSGWLGSRSKEECWGRTFPQAHTSFGVPKGGHTKRNPTAHQGSVDGGDGGGARVVLTGVTTLETRSPTPTVRPFHTSPQHPRDPRPGVCRDERAENRRTSSSTVSDHPPSRPRGSDLSLQRKLQLPSLQRRLQLPSLQQRLQLPSPERRSNRRRGSSKPPCLTGWSHPRVCRIGERTFTLLRLRLESDSGGVSRGRRRRCRKKDHGGKRSGFIQCKCPRGRVRDEDLFDGSLRRNG